MKITFVNDSVGFGGAAKVMAVIAQGLRKRGHNVSIINLNTRKVAISQDINGVEVVTADIPY